VEMLKVGFGSKILIGKTYSRHLLTLITPFLLGQGAGQ
jgi:hypothetical protein